MYSGTTFRVKSGRVMGVHQRIDRLAHRALRARLQKDIFFPTSREIVHFEGLNGPDGIKRKSPSVDEPWHHIDPSSPSDRQLLGLIEDHIVNLSRALRNGNRERAAFEAAWLSHAVTDGLTPAHHDNLGAKIEELWGKAHHERSSVKDKALIKGKGPVDTFRKNWKYWGAGGIFTAHIGYEWGVATALSTLAYSEHMYPSKEEYQRLIDDGYEALFLEALHTIAHEEYYRRYIQKGWDHSLTVETRTVLVPTIIRLVTLAWYDAVLRSESKQDLSR